MTTKPYPQDLGAERALLGQLMLDPGIRHLAAERITAAAFYRQDHGALFDLLTELGPNGDAATLPGILERRGAHRYGGVAYALDLVEHVPSTANWGHYVDTITDHAHRRAVIAAADVSRAAAWDFTRPIAEVVAEHTAATAAAAAGGSGSHWYSLAEITETEAAERIERNRRREAGETVAVPLGLADLEADLGGGMFPGDLVILAGRPTHGKTALAWGVAVAAARAGVVVGFHQLEMPREGMLQRSLAGETGCPVFAQRTGDIRHGQWEDLDKASRDLAELPIYIDDRPGLSLAEVQSSATTLHVKQGLGLLVVDYLQLMRLTTIGNRSEGLGEISTGLKTLAKRLGIPVLALAQLNRGCESREDMRPRPSDLRGSGNLEQDADVILFIYRDEVYNPADTKFPGIAEIIRSKVRNGGTGTTLVGFEGERVRFRDLTIDERRNERIDR